RTALQVRSLHLSLGMALRDQPPCHPGLARRARIHRLLPDPDPRPDLLPDLRLGLHPVLRLDLVPDLRLVRRLVPRLDLVPVLVTRPGPDPLPPRRECPPRHRPGHQFALSPGFEAVRCRARPVIVPTLLPFVREPRVRRSCRAESLRWRQRSWISRVVAIGVRQHWMRPEIVPTFPSGTPPSSCRASPRFSGLLQPHP